MDFTQMRDLLIIHFNAMTKDIDHLYEVEVDKDELWNLYLDSFPEGTNEIYRQRREHDCSCCRQFVKGLGNVVVINQGKVETIWDFRTDDDVYQPVLDALSSYIKAHTVSDYFVTHFAQYGALKNYEAVEDGKVKEWTHFYLELPKRFVNSNAWSIGEVKGQLRDVRNVFKRSLDEITEDSILTLLELIASNSLYRGEAWKAVLEQFLQYKREYEGLAGEIKELYAWEYAHKAGVSVGKIRNSSIGTLLINISEGMDLEVAVRKYEQITAPSNYKRPQAIYTKRMLEDAQKKITELGYLESLPRRFATLDDINVNDILFSNKDAAKRMGVVDVFTEMIQDVKVDPKKFSRVEEISVEKFVSDILPTTQELEVYLENRHAGNMVSLIAPVNRESKPMFKWENNFGWAYAGNVTDSMKERVKAAGGRVDGVLRFSIQWNDLNQYSYNDVDAHCICPDKGKIYFGSKVHHRTGGNLDVDIRYPKKGIPAVENITWPDKSRMIPGTYQFIVNQFDNRGGTDGFRAEIEFDGKIYSFDYNKNLRTRESVVVAEVTLDINGNFSIVEKLPSTTSSKEIWGVKSNQFVPVSVMCYSPNYWNQQQGIGHRHYFFMLKDCVSPETPNGFYNEFLSNELIPHRKVMEALGSRLKVQETADQLSGVGFSSSKRDEVIVKVKGATERIFKIKF